MQNNYPKAIDAFRHALNLNPRFTQAMVSLTLAYLKAGNTDLGKKTCDDLASVDPKLAGVIRMQIH